MFAAYTGACFYVWVRHTGACTPRVLPTGARTGQFAGVPAWAIPGVAALRSALHSNRTFTTRGLYFIDRLGFAKKMWNVEMNELGVGVGIVVTPASLRKYNVVGSALIIKYQHNIKG